MSTPPLVLSGYAQFLMPDVGQADVVVNDFEVRGLLWGTVEGPQMVIEWSPPLVPSLVSEIRLLRKRYGPPDTVTDGLQVFSQMSPVQDATFFVDLNVEACTNYFYRMFSRRTSDGTWFAGQFGDEITAHPAFHGLKFWELMPRDYKIKDLRPGNEAFRHRGLAPVQDLRPGFYEYFNLGEDPKILRGQLERFLRVFGTHFDLAKSLIDCFLKIVDVDETPSRFLPFLAKIVGVELNRELPVIRQREEIKSAVPTYRIKGTDLSLTGAVSSIAGFPVILQWQGSTLLVSNREDRTSLDDLNPNNALIGLPGDELDYSLGDATNPYTVIMYLMWDGTRPLTPPILAKIRRKIPEVAPADVNVPVVILEVPAQENYSATTYMTDTFSDTIPP